MEILLNQRNNKIVATDDLDGEFYKDSNNIIMYTHPSESTSWTVANSLESFLLSLDFFNNYKNEVIKAQTETEELLCVNQFKQNLKSIYIPLNVSNSYWSIILDQCEWGHI